MGTLPDESLASKATHTPGPVQYTCKKCGWSGEVNAPARCLACYRAAVKRWRASNRDKHLAQKRRYDAKARAERPEEYNARRRRHRKRSTNQKNYRNRIEWLAQGDVTRDQLQEIYENAGGKCHYCNCPVNARFYPNDPRGFDHVISRANGGCHTASNIVVSCGKCNARKG